MRFLLRSASLVAVVTAITEVTSLASPALVEAATPRSGATCTARQNGSVSGRADTRLICTQIITCSGTRRQIWISFRVTDGGPTAADRARYGECQRTIPTAPEVQPGAGSGVRCIVGTWVLSAASLKAYLIEATGSPEAVVDFTGTLRITISGGSINGDQLSGATIAATGSMTGRSPDGIVSGRIATVAGGRIDASENALSGRQIATLFTYQITVNGQELPIEQIDVSGSGITAYECSGSALTFTVDIPAAAGQPARRARMILTRG